MPQIQDTWNIGWYMKHIDTQTQKLGSNTSLVSNRHTLVWSRHKIPDSTITFSISQTTWGSTGNDQTLNNSINWSRLKIQDKELETANCLTKRSHTGLAPDRAGEAFPLFYWLLSLTLRSAFAVWRKNWPAQRRDTGSHPALFTPGLSRTSQVRPFFFLLRFNHEL